MAGVTWTPILSSLLILLAPHLRHAHSQATPTCDTLTAGDLGTSTHPSTTGLIAATLTRPDTEIDIPLPDFLGTPLHTPMVQILAYRTVCESAGQDRGTADSVSVIVEFSCTGQTCGAANSSITIINTLLFSFDCVEEFSKYRYSAKDVEGRDPVGVVAMGTTKEGCGRCVDPGVVGDGMVCVGE